MLYVTCLNSCVLYWRPSATRAPPTASVLPTPLIPYLSHKKFLSAPYTLCCFCALVSSICSHSLQDSSFPFSFLSITMTMLLFMLSLSSTLSWILFSFNPLHWMEPRLWSPWGQRTGLQCLAQHKCGIHSKLYWGSEGNLPHCSLLLWRHLYLQFYFYLEDSFWEQVI